MVFGKCDVEFFMQYMFGPRISELKDVGVLCPLKLPLHVAEAEAMEI